MDHVQKARELFLDGYNCAQSMFCAFCDVTGMDFDTALRMTSSMGGGMGRLREVCGACSSMFLIMGMLYGYEGTGADGSKAAHYAEIQKMAHAFEAQHGSYICRELIASMNLPVSTDPTPDARTPEYYQHRACLKYIESTAAMLDAYIAERGLPEKK